MLSSAGRLTATSAVHRNDDAVRHDKEELSVRDPSLQLVGLSQNQRGGVEGGGWEGGGAGSISLATSLPCAYTSIGQAFRH